MRRIFLLAVYVFFLIPAAMAQDTVRLSLTELLKAAEINYPRLKAARYQLEAAQANIKLRQQSSIPQLDASYQANLATHNNISGLWQPQFVPPISGPPSAANDYSPVTGSAASLLLQWEPGFFGDRKANINVAATDYNVQQSRLEQDIFSQKVRASEKYIDLVSYQQLLKLYSENSSISERLLRQVSVLAQTGIKPGVDTAMISTSLSSTRIEWLKIKNSLNGILFSLQELVATDSVIINKDSLFYAQVPSVTLDGLNEHPSGKTARLSIENSKAERIVITKLTAPRLSFWGTTYGRGSGVDYTGNSKTMEGFSLSRFNYGAGLQLSLPLLKHAETKIRLHQQDLLIKSQEQNFEQVSLDLKEQRKLAAAAFSSALAILHETPIQVNAAQYAFKAMQVRYTTGLVDYTQLLLAQSALLKARIELVKSQAEIWKALLYKAATNGNLDLFINQVR